MANTNASVILSLQKLTIVLLHLSDDGNVAHQNLLIFVQDNQRARIGGNIYRPRNLRPWLDVRFHADEGRQRANDIVAWCCLDDAVGKRNKVNTLTAGCSLDSENGGGRGRDR